MPQLERLVPRLQFRAQNQRLSGKRFGSQSRGSEISVFDEFEELLGVQFRVFGFAVQSLSELQKRLLRTHLSEANQESQRTLARLAFLITFVTLCK